MQKPRIAIVYDHLATQYGGAEYVLQVLLKTFPQAPLFTSVYNPKNVSWVPKSRVKTSFLQKFPFKEKHRLFLPFYPIAFESLNLQEYDVVISVTAGEAKGIITQPHQVHLSYILTPQRYLYSQEDHLTGYGFNQNVMTQFLAKKVLEYIKWWDQTAITRVDRIYTLSNKIKNKINTTYKKSSTVLYPPIPAVQKDTTTLPITEYFLSLSRLVWYKKVDLVIKALKDSKQTLIIVGNGPEKKQLLKIAGNAGREKNPSETLEYFLQTAKNHNQNILFITECSESQKAQLISNCKALLALGEEDFGITPLEVAGYGKPSIINTDSGCAEIMKDKTHVIQVKNPTVTKINNGINNLLEIDWNSHKLIQLHSRYTEINFTSQFKRIVYDLWHSSKI